MKRLTVASISCAIALTFAAILTWAGTGPGELALHQLVPTRPANSTAAGFREGRVLLSRAQVQEALRAGTLDRPVRSLLAVGAPLAFGDYVWNDRSVPDGPTWIRVDLRSQLISIFRGGDEIGTAVIVYGGDNKETPLGKLRVLAKAREHHSSIYDAPMPYTLRLTDDGVSIHGSSVRWGAATHGCIGIPLPFAKRLFDVIKVGDEVLIVRGKRAEA